MRRKEMVVGLKKGRIYVYQFHYQCDKSVHGWVPPWSNLFISCILMFRPLIEVRLCELANKTRKIVDSAKKSSCTHGYTCASVDDITQFQSESQMATFARYYKIHAYAEWAECCRMFFGFTFHNLADLFVCVSKSVKNQCDEQRRRPKKPLKHPLDDESPFHSTTIWHLNLCDPFRSFFALNLSFCKMLCHEQIKWKR